MTGLLELLDKPLSEMEGEIDQTLPQGKYVLRFLRATKKVSPDKDDPSREVAAIYVNFAAARPLNPVADWNPSRYETLLLTYSDRNASDFVRFLKASGLAEGTHPMAFLATLGGRQYVADVSYTPNKNPEGKPYTNIRGLVPFDVYEARMAKISAPVVTGSDDDELE